MVLSNLMKRSMFLESVYSTELLTLNEQLPSLRYIYNCGLQVSLCHIR